MTINKVVTAQHGIVAYLIALLLIANLLAGPGSRTVLLIALSLLTALGALACHSRSSLILVVVGIWCSGFLAIADHSNGVRAYRNVIHGLKEESGKTDAAPVSPPKKRSN